MAPYPLGRQESFSVTFYRWACTCLATWIGPFQDNVVAETEMFGAARIRYGVGLL